MHAGMGNPPHPPYDAVGRSGRMLDDLATVLIEVLDPLEREALRPQLERYVRVKPSPAVWARLLRSLDRDDERLN